MTRADLDYLINGIVTGLGGSGGARGTGIGSSRGGIRGAVSVDDDEVDELYKKYLEDISKIEERRYEKRRGATRTYLENQDKIKENDEKIIELQDKLNDTLDRRNELLEKRDDGTITDDEKEELKDLIKDWEEYNKAIEENTRLKEDNANTSLVGSIASDVKKVISSIKESKQELEEFMKPWTKIDATASKYAKTLGLTKKGMDELAKSSLNNLINRDLAAKYDISTEELLEAQENYMKASGRHIRVDFDDQETIAAMKSMGSNGLELAALYDNFGVSLEETGNRMGKMFSDASKQGISFEKYSDNVAKNIKIAQNYTFKNGLKGLESMAKKATAMKMDMQQVAQLADKVSTVEGAIDVSAQLQVLGGPFAQLADPIGMLNEGLNDMEGLQDRLIKMVGGLGSFDKETGEVKVSAFNKQRLKAATSAMGLDYSAIMESVNAQARRREIEKQISASQIASGFDDDMKELIKNSGTIKNGKAGVSINGEFKTLDQIKSGDKDAIIKESRTDSENIKSIAYTLESIEQKISGASKAQDAVQAKAARKMADWYAEMLHFSSKIEPLLWVVTSIEAILLAIKLYETGRDIIDTFRGRGGRRGRAGGSGNRRKPAGRNKPKPTGGNKPKPTGGNKPKPASGNKPKPTGGNKPKPASGNKPAGGNPSGGRGPVKPTTPTPPATPPATSPTKPTTPSTPSKPSGGTTSGMPEVKPGEVAERVGRKKFIDWTKKKGGQKVTEEVIETTGKKTADKVAERVSKEITEEVGEKVLQKTATKAVTKGATSSVAGMATPIGWIGAGVDLGADILAEYDIIEKGGAAHATMSGLGTAAEWASIGAAAGSVVPGVGNVAGAIIGGVGGLAYGVSDALGMFDTPDFGPRPTLDEMRETNPDFYYQRDATRVQRPIPPPPLPLDKSLPLKGITPPPIDVPKYEEIKLSIKPVPNTGSNNVYSTVNNGNKEIHIKTDPQEIKLNGTLNLRGQDGKSIDIIDTLSKDKVLLTSLSSQVSNEIKRMGHGSDVSRDF